MLPPPRVAKRRLVIPILVIVALAGNVLASSWAMSAELVSRLTFNELLITGFTGKSANEALQVATSFDGAQQVAYLKALAKAVYGEPVTIDRLSRDAAKAKASLDADAEAFTAQTRTTNAAWMVKRVADLLLALLVLLLAAREVSDIRRANTAPANRSA